METHQNTKPHTRRCVFVLVVGGKWVVLFGRCGSALLARESERERDREAAVNSDPRLDVWVWEDVPLCSEIFALDL